MNVENLERNFKGSLSSSQTSDTSPLPRYSRHSYGDSPEKMLRKRHFMRPDTSLPFEKNPPYDPEDLVSSTKSSFVQPPEDYWNGKVFSRRVVRVPTALKIQGDRDMISTNRSAYPKIEGHQDAPRASLPISIIKKSLEDSDDILKIQLDTGEEVVFKIPQMLPDQYYSSSEKQQLHGLKRQ